MVKIQHKQSDEVREISRDEWENSAEYKAMRAFWQVLEEGDPVRVYWIEDNGQHTDLGLKDRDHAKNMIKINSKQCYYKEIEDVVLSKPGEGDEPELLDEILNLVLSGGMIHLSMDTTDNYRNAVKKLVALGLIRPKGKTYEYTRDGLDAKKAGGVEEWLVKDEQKQKPRTPIIDVRGHAIIGNNNTGNSQGRDFLNSQSPTVKNSPQQAQPKPNPINKSDHTIWDKIKYISGIVAGLGAVAALGAKLLDWW